MILNFKPSAVEEVNIAQFVQLITFEGMRHRKEYFKKCFAKFNNLTIYRSIDISIFESIYVLMYVRTHVHIYSL